MSSRLLAPLLLLLIALGLRLPAFGLPVEGEAARLASVAELVGNERGWVPAETAPVMPVMAAVLVASGIAPTDAIRLIDLLFGALIAPLLFLLGRSLGLSMGLAVWCGLFAAAHPLLAINAGGVHPGPSGVALACLLSALLLLRSERSRTRRAGALVSTLLILSHSAGALYGIPLLAYYALREPGPRLQLLLPAAGLVALLLGPVAPWRTSGEITGVGGLLLGWLPLAGLGVVWVMSGVGMRRLGSGDSPGSGAFRTWAIGAALHLIALVALPLGPAAGLELDGPSGGILLVPFVLLTGLVGWARAAAGIPKLAPGIRTGRRAVCLGAVAGSLLLVSGALQVLVLPASPAAAGRLTWLRDAVAQASAAAGERGWIVLGVAEDDPATQASLADAHPGRALCRRAPLDEKPDEDGLRVLLPFPAGAYPADQPFAVVVHAPRRDADATVNGVTTFGGEGIFEQEPVSRVGAYLVMRVQGARAADEERRDE